TAFDHLWQIHLRGQAHGVIAVRCEVRRVDIVVRIELDHIVVNLLRLGDERSVVLRWAGAGREQKAQTEGELPFDVLHVSSVSGTATWPVEYSPAGVRRGSAGHRGEPRAGSCG